MRFNEIKLGTSLCDGKLNCRQFCTGKRRRDHYGRSGRLSNDDWLLSDDS